MWLLGSSQGKTNGMALECLCCWCNMLHPEVCRCTVTIENKNWNITYKSYKSYYVIVVAVIVAVPSWVLNQNAEIKSHWMPSLRHLMECFILLMKAAYSCPSFGSHQETLPIGATRRVLVSHLLGIFCDSCWRSYGTNCDNIYLGIDPHKSTMILKWWNEILGKCTQ